MKKSRIIVPALAMLTLSVAASVTGTVAWFTASRTASMSLTNLAAIDTTGDLGLTIIKGNQANDASGVDTKLLALQPMRDFSYNVSTDKGYYAVLDNEGNNIISTKEVSPVTPVGINTWKAQEYATSSYLYYANTFTGIFTSSSNTPSYLFFNTNHSKSGLSKNYNSDNATGDGIDESKSIYRALRVSMVAETYTGESVSPDEGTKKTIVWAPYRDPSAVINLQKEGELATALSVNTLNPTVGNYNEKNSGEPATSLAVDTNTIAEVVTQSGADVITQNSSASTAATHATNLSTTLDATKKVKVKFTIWFEGLDACCHSNAENIFSAATYASEATKEIIKMNFFAIQANAFLG